MNDEQKRRLQSLGGGDDLSEILESMGVTVVDIFLNGAYSIRNAVPLSQPSKACLEIIRQGMVIIEQLKSGDLSDFFQIVIDNAMDDDFAVTLIRNGAYIYSTLGPKKLRTLSAEKDKVKVEAYAIEIKKLYDAAVGKEYIRRCFAIWDLAGGELSQFIMDAISLHTWSAGRSLNILEAINLLNLSEATLYHELILCIVHMLKNEPDKVDNFLDLVKKASEIGLEWTIIGSYGKGTYDQGLTAGYIDGHAKGYKAGYGKGKAAGHSKGYTDGYEEGYDKASRKYNDHHDRDDDPCS
ncbi:MAG: hypothetical protein WAV31_03410 [Candidatus Moraniibacteriota bacterium]